MSFIPCTPSSQSRSFLRQYVTLENMLVNFLRTFGKGRPPTITVSCIGSVWEWHLEEEDSNVWVRGLNERVGLGVALSDPVHQRVVVDYSARHIRRRRVEEQVTHARAWTNWLNRVMLKAKKRREEVFFLFFYEFWSFDFKFQIQNGFENIYPFNQNKLNDKTHAPTWNTTKHLILYLFELLNCSKSNLIWKAYEA